MKKTLLLAAILLVLSACSGSRNLLITKTGARE